MKALTISQPYASLIADGSKWIENRRWETKYRGPLAIHAGKGTQYMTGAQLTRYPSGVLAVCDLVACFRLVDVGGLGERLSAFGLTVEDVVGHEHAEGPWCWLLRNVRKLERPVMAQGKQGLWDWAPPAGVMAPSAVLEPGSPFGNAGAVACGKWWPVGE